MKRILLTLVIMLITSPMMLKAEQKVILVTVDGYRWQELFGGADSLLINQKEFGDVNRMKEMYWRSTPEERRQALMPFTWSFIYNHGVMIGNRWEGSKMNVTNQMWFSYPGYHELLCGFADDENINSNAPLPNPHPTVFEVAQQSPQYKNAVLCFGSWGRFIEIFNEERSGLKINANYRHAMTEKPTSREKYLDKLTELCPRYWGEERFDFLTHEYAMEALRTQHPKFVFIGYGDTDEWAHAGRYQLYLDAARSTDAYLQELWNLLQSDPFYKDQTTVIVTCDHGRGDKDKKGWLHHGKSVENSDQTWLMAFGKGIPAQGIYIGNYYNNQIAPTIAYLLGIKFQPNYPGIGEKFDLRFSHQNKR